MNEYTATAKTLHWSIVFLLLYLFVSAGLMDVDSELVSKAFIYTSHKTAGLLVLILTLVRLGWRFAHKPPKLDPKTMPLWQIRTAHVTHCLLYIVAFLTPLAGWAMVSASPYGFAFFGVWDVPKLPVSQDSMNMFLESHGMLASAFAFLIAAHIGAAIWHHFVDKDDILLRMTPNVFAPALNRLRCK